MKKPIELLASQLNRQLQVCATSHKGEFKVESSRDHDVIAFHLPGVPSSDFRANEEDLEFLALLAHDNTLTPPRSLGDVSAMILYRLNDICVKSNGNGIVEVFCRRQNNGKLRIRIRQRYDDELVLWPKEI